MADGILSCAADYVDRSFREQQGHSTPARRKAGAANRRKIELKSFTQHDEIGRRYDARLKIHRG